MNDKLYEFTVYLNNGTTVSVEGTERKTYLNEGEMIIYKGSVAQAVFRLSNIAGYTISPGVEIKGLCNHKDCSNYMNPDYSKCVVCSEV